MWTPGALAVTAALSLAAASAPVVGRTETVRPGEPSDGIELGLWGHDTPEALRKAKADPYAAPASPACETIPREIAALDEVLGPDADEPLQKTRMRARANRLVGQALRGFIPHRDVVRFVTGADKRDKALNQAAMAGWARRGFLRGMEINLGCNGHGTGEQVAAAHAETGLARDVSVRTGPVTLGSIRPIETAEAQPLGEPTEAHAAATPATDTADPTKAPAHHGWLHAISDGILEPAKAFVR